MKNVELAENATSVKIANWTGCNVIRREMYILNCDKLIKVMRKLLNGTFPGEQTRAL